MRSLLIAEVLSDPLRVKALTLAEWDLLIRQARRSGALARLAFLLESSGLLDAVPETPLRYLESARHGCRQIDFSLSWEISRLKEALQDSDIPLIFLKGAAYFLAGNLASKGRYFSDIDILVAENNLQQAEHALVYAGWKSGHLDAYDQRYYRQWMHELPPMQHVQRQSSIDVHHNILPKTCANHPDAERLLSNIVSIEHHDVWVLAPEDRVIHSASHLFHEGELENGFRDLSDLDLLLKEFSGEQSFWERLLARTVALKQQTTIFYALRYCVMILKTPVPASVLEKSFEQNGKQVYLPIMDFLFSRALLPDHPSCNDRYTALARGMLYLRGHWLRMPLRLLLPHLLRKIWLKWVDREQSQ